MARTPEHKKLLTNLAQSWINFAAEIERTNALLSEPVSPFQANPSDAGASRH
jgi:hypothetical protein